MKRYILISILILFSKFSNSQNYIPLPMENASWRIWWGCSHCANCMMYMVAKTKGDTIINSVTYIKIMKHVVSGGCYNCSDCSNSFGPGYQGAIRQDIIGKKIFIILPNDTIEKILYDFTQNVGDTLNSVLSVECYPDIISSIDSILIGNTYHRRINTFPTGCNNPGTQLIEGIGTDKGLIESTMWFEIVSILMCATYNNQTIYPDTTSYCDVTVNINEINDYIQTIVYPNPFTDNFEINFSQNTPDIVFNLYDIFGRIIISKEFSNVNAVTVKRENLSSGIYFYQIISRNDIISTGKVIAE